MKVYTTLLAFSQGVKLITDKSNQPPTCLVLDTEEDTLATVRKILHFVSGVDPGFYPYINQAGTFEYFEDEKLIYIVYVVYFPSTFDLVNDGYKWTSVGELKNDSKLYSIIRYIYGNKKYV